VPTVSGENLVFSIVPSLPNGLSFDTATGVISGTPTDLQSPTDYEVTATNSGGSVSFVLSIEIIDAAPSSLSYSTPNVFTIDETIGFTTNSFRRKSSIFNRSKFTKRIEF
jgi:hypothetical protein